MLAVLPHGFSSGGDRGLRRGGFVLICAMLVMAGCTGGAVHPATSPGSRASTVRLWPGASRSVELERLVLRADLDERPRRWEKVLFIPFGDGPGELGFKSFPEGPSSLPSSIAVAPDGSFWIGDRWKKRAAHYSPTGRFLGAVEGVSARDRGWDIASVGGRIYLLADQETGRVGVDDGHGRFRFVNVTVGREPTFLFQIVSSPLGLLGQAPGDSADLGQFLQLDLPDSPEGRPLPGLPYGRGNVFFDATRTETSSGDQDFDLMFRASEQSSLRPLHVDLITQGRGTSISLPAEVGLVEPAPVGEDVLMLVKVAPTRPDDAEKFGGGRWLLRVGSSPLLWERLPYPQIPDELQHRHLAVGSDGSIYLMVVQTDGELILRRPAS